MYTIGSENEQRLAERGNSQSASEAKLGSYINTASRKTFDSQLTDSAQSTYWEFVTDNETSKQWKFAGNICYLQITISR